MVSFYKYQGTGNDFIIFDNRDTSIQLSTAQINQLCNRKFGIGADGLMLLNLKEGYDFEMIYYNADGKESSMCGNGGRCLTQFAFDRGIQKTCYKFMAIDGEHEAIFSEEGWVNLKMIDVNTIIKHNGDYIVNTGSPHLVHPTSNVMTYDVVKNGHEIRYSCDFKEEGINVNFVESIDEDKIIVRTYERGVEDETLSCGTGVTAAALMFAHNENGFNRIDVTTLGGNLAVEFDKITDEQFSNIWLCGPATFVFKGEIIL
ncbi:MAG: diaminopimelate epimerase [Deinococcales bacterium]|nr:diaminopimelate epimerase [Chitinophagaceae bacterium]